MGRVHEAEPVKPFCAMLAGEKEWLDLAVRCLAESLGVVESVSEDWSFGSTDYYEGQMGPGLVRRIVSFRDLMDPAEIATWKLFANGLERRLAARIEGGPERPVNLDPGYVACSKLVLATTKNYTHRMYLGRGIYAEVTLRWRGGRFDPLEWTYPDYRTERYRDFFARVRERYMEQRHG